METERKQFIKSVAAMLPGLFLAPGMLRREVLGNLRLFEAAPIPQGKTLVVIQMAGGNDGLNTVIPYSDSQYYKYRPNLAIPPEKVLPLNPEIGLHPNLEKIKLLWDAGLLAIVEGVGYPNPNYSHFESMNIWQTASWDGSSKDGWLGRYLSGLNLTSADIFPGLAVAAKTPPELYSGKVNFPVVQSIPTYRFQSDPIYPAAASSRLSTLSSLYTAASSKSNYLRLLGDTEQVVGKSSQELMAASQSYQAKVIYPNTPLAKNLQLLAQAITGNLGVIIGQVAIGSFDTHINQGPVQGRLFTELAEAVYAFYQDLQEHGKEKDVVIMTWSEFGRRVQSNASNGTDHGSAAPLFVIGGPVGGGLYGQRPDLGNLDNGNLRFTTDFRSVYATLLEKWLGASAGDILGAGPFPLLDFLA